MTLETVSEHEASPAEIEEELDVLASASAGPAAVRGGALRIIGYAGASLLALVAGALLYRHLGVVDSGHYTAALSLVALVAAVSDLGLTAVGIRELSLRSGREREQMTGTLLGLRLTITSVGVIGVSIFALIAYGAELGLGVLLAGIGLLFAIWQGTLAIPLMVDLRLGWATLLEFLRQLVQSGLIVAFVVGGAGLLTFLAVPIPAGVFVLVLTMLLFRGRLPMSLRFVPSEWRALVAPVVAYSAAVAAAALYFRIAILLVSLFSPGHQLGYFGLSFNVVAALFVIPPMLITAAFPIFSRAARDDHARLAYSIERVFEVALIVGAWISLAIALSAHFAIKVIGGPKFAPAGEVLQIQGISVGATFVATVWGFALLSLGRHRTILLFNVWALLAVAAVVAVLASLDGARGAAIGTSAVEVVNVFIAYRLLIHGRRHLSPSLRVVPKVVIAIAIATLPVLLPVGEVAQVVISAVLYFIALLALRALPVELLDLMPWRRVRPA